MGELSKLLKIFFENAHDPVALTHEDKGVFYYANKAYCKMVGYSLEELQKLSVIELDTDLTPQNFAKIKNSAIEQDPFVKETNLKRKDGKIIPVEKSIKYIQTDFFSGFYVLHRDISDKKIMRNRINDHNKVMELISYGSSAGLWTWNINQDKVVYSAKYKEILGFSDKTDNDEIYRHWQNNINQEDIALLYRKFTDCLKRKTEFNFEYRIKDKLGYEKWVSSSAIVSCDKDGRPKKMGGSIIDITSLKEQLIANKELSKKLDIFRFFVESAPYGLIIINSIDKIIFANSAAYDEFGHKSKIVGSNINVVFDNFKDVSWSKVKSMAKKDESYKFDGVFYSDESKKYISSIAHNIEYNGENCICITAADITSEKVTQNLLEQSEQRFRLAAKASQDGIWEAMIGKDEQYWSERYYEILGYKKGEIQPSRTNFYQSIHPDDISKVRKTYQNYIKDKGLYNVEMRLKTKSGEYKWFQSCAYCNWDGNQAVRMVGTLRDINQRKLREQEIIRSNKKLEDMNRDLEEFAHIASHDLKQPLHGIHAYASFLAEDNADILSDESKMMLSRLQQQASYMDELITRLLAYSKTSKKEGFKLVDINNVVHDVVQSIQTYIDDQNGEVIIEGDLHEIMCNKEIISELFRNLIVNGIKYNYSKRKKVTIFCEEADNVIIYHIKDNGIGIHKKYHDVIFGLFKRLHPRDKYGGGTGFGLTLVKKIVDLHKGGIRINSAEGLGSDFIISLPKK